MMKNNMLQIYDLDQNGIYDDGKIRNLRFKH